MKQSDIKKNNEKKLEPIKILPTRKVEKANGRTYYYFETPGDAIRPRFTYASEFSNYSGVWMAIVQKESDSLYQMMNIYGQLSDQMFKNLSDKQAYYMALKSKTTFEGEEIRPKRFQDDEGFYFILPDATQTKRFSWATQFDDDYWRDFAIVSEGKDGYRVLNTKAELSDTYFAGKHFAAKMIMSNLLNFTESALITAKQMETEIEPLQPS